MVYSIDSMHLSNGHMYPSQFMQIANTIQADIGQMPSSRYRHIGPMRVAYLGPSGFAPWANVVSTSAPASAR